MGKIKVLFICRGNSVRSQMAEAILRNYGREQFDVASAGITPAPVHRFTKYILEQHNIDHSDLRPQNVLEFKDKNIDYIIVLSEVAWYSLPDFKGAPKKLKWFIDDPIGVRGSDEMVEQAFEMTFKKIESKIESYFNI